MLRIIDKIKFVKKHTCTKVLSRGVKKTLENIIKVDNICLIHHPTLEITKPDQAFSRNN